LETKVEHAENDVILLSDRFKKEKDALVDEIKILKQVVRNKNEEAVKKEKELSEVSKVLKSKKEEIQKLDNRQDNLQQKIKDLKENGGKLKVDTQKAEKALFKLEKKVNVDHKKLEGKIKDLELKLLSSKSETNAKNSVSISSTEVTASATSTHSSCNSVTPPYFPCSITSNMVSSSPTHLNNPATSQDSLLHSSQSFNLKTSPTSFQASSNWTSHPSSQAIPVSNVFQALETDSDTPYGEDDQEDYEVNNNSNDNLEAVGAKVREEKDEPEESVDRKPKELSIVLTLQYAGSREVLLIPLTVMLVLIKNLSLLSINNQ
jgi:hypothetical protein